MHGYWFAEGRHMTSKKEKEKENENVLNFGSLSVRETEGCVLKVSTLKNPPW